MEQWQQTDPDGPSEADIERFGSEFKTCPDCGDEVYDQAEFCTACNHAFEGADEPSGIPMWAMLIAALLLIAFVLFGVLV